MTTAIFILPDQMVTGWGGANLSFLFVMVAFPFLPDYGVTCWGGATVSLIFLTAAIYFYLTMGQHVGEVQLLVLYF